MDLGPKWFYVTVCFQCIFCIAVKPRFFTEYLKSYSVIEGESLNLTMNATGNPPQIHYKWILPQSANPAKIRTEGPFISIKDAGRQDRGNYTILAWNGHGNFNTTVTIYIDVLYPPRYTFYII